jgi:hypothetical protein
MRLAAVSLCSARSQFAMMDAGNGGFTLNLSAAGLHLNGATETLAPMSALEPYWLEVVNGLTEAEARLWPVGTSRPIDAQVTAAAAAAIDTLRFLGGNYCAPVVRIDWVQIYADV